MLAIEQRLAMLGMVQDVVKRLVANAFVSLDAWCFGLRKHPHGYAHVCPNENGYNPKAKPSRRRLLLNRRKC